MYGPARRSGAGGLSGARWQKRLVYGSDSGERSPEGVPKRH